MISLKHYHTMQLEAHASRVISCESVDQLKVIAKSGELFDSAHYLLLGDGSNVVFLDDFPGVIVLNRLLGMDVVKESEGDVLLEVAAGESWHELVMRCNALGYSGIENLALIPGRVGAAPVQNIGAYGVELSDVCEQVSVMDLRTGESHMMSHEACGFGYRSSVFQQEPWKHHCITAVRLRLRKKHHAWCLDYPPLAKALTDVPLDQLTGSRISDAVMSIRQSRLPDPVVLPNAGSFFKNPVVSIETFKAIKEQHPALPHFAAGDRIKLPAGWLIEQCGLKGYREGPMGTYEQHALVLVNHGGATGEQLRVCVNHIKHAVFERFGVMLETEVGCYQKGLRLAGSCVVLDD